jgi:membrane-bound lytic murein transglycosylase B
MFSRLRRFSLRMPRHGFAPSSKPSAARRSQAGIPPDLYDRATATIAINPRVEQLNLSQPEFVRPVWDYIESAVTETRVNKGRDLIGVNAGLFARLQAQYGVPEEVITAIWGMETATAPISARSICSSRWRLSPMTGRVPPMAAAS